MGWRVQDVMPPLAYDSGSDSDDEEQIGGPTLADLTSGAAVQPTPLDLGIEEAAWSWSSFIAASAWPSDSCSAQFQTHRTFFSRAAPTPCRVELPGVVRLGMEFVGHGKQGVDGGGSVVRHSTTPGGGNRD